MKKRFCNNFQYSQLEPAKFYLSFGIIRSVRGEKSIGLNQHAKDIAEQVAQLEKDARYLHNKIQTNQLTAISILFFGITIAFFLNLYANSVHEQFHNYKYYQIVVIIILVVLLIIGYMILKELLIKPLDIEYKRIRDQAHSLKNNIGQFSTKTRSFKKKS